MKALLSGAPLENTILRKRTFVAKTLGLLFAIGSGLYVGKEGPWVHTSTPRESEHRDSLLSARNADSLLQRAASIICYVLATHIPFFRNIGNVRDGSSSIW